MYPSPPPLWPPRVLEQPVLGSALCSAVPYRRHPMVDVRAAAATGEHAASVKPEVFAVDANRDRLVGNGRRESRLVAGRHVLVAADGDAL